MTVVSDVAKRGPNTQLSLALKLVQPEHKEFDLSKSKIIENMFKSIDEKSINEFLSRLITTFNEQNVEVDQRIADNQRIWALNQMLSLCKNNHITRNESWLKPLCQFLVFHSFFEKSKNFPKKITSKPLQELEKFNVFNYVSKVSDKVRDVTVKRLTSFVKELTNIKIGNEFIRIIITTVVSNFF